MFDWSTSVTCALTYIFRSWLQSGACCGWKLKKTISNVCHNLLILIYCKDGDRDTICAMDNHLRDCRPLGGHEVEIIMRTVSAIRMGLLRGFLKVIFSCGSPDIL